MKKLLVFAIATVVGVMANAASLTWGGAVADAEGSTDPLPNVVAYLFASATDVGSAAGGRLEVDGSTYNLYDAGGNKLNATMVQSHTLDADELSQQVFASTYSVDGAGVDGFYNVIIVNGTGAAGDNFATYYTSVSGTTATSPTTNIQVNPDWDDSGTWFGDPSSGLGYTGTTGGGGGIPEPTSGLLLLIGGSLLALRRKQK